MCQLTLKHMASWHRKITDRINYRKKCIPVNLSCTVKTQSNILTYWVHRPRTDSLVVGLVNVSIIITLFCILLQGGDLMQITQIPSKFPKEEEGGDSIIESDCRFWLGCVWLQRRRISGKVKKESEQTEKHSESWGLESLHVSSGIRRPFTMSRSRKSLSSTRTSHLMQPHLSLSSSRCC